MTQNEASDISNLPMTTLRKGFAGYCRLLGLDMETCISLTLLLNSRELLIAIMQFMVVIYQNGLKPEVTDDMTTTVVRVAVELREAWDEMKNKSYLSTTAKAEE